MAPGKKRKKFYFIGSFVVSLVFFGDESHDAFGIINREGKSMIGKRFRGIWKGFNIG